MKLVPIKNNRNKFFHERLTDSLLNRAIDHKTTSSDSSLKQSGDDYVDFKPQRVLTFTDKLTGRCRRAIDQRNPL